MERFIHLLYVPTMACNMQCRYCYLGDGTKAIATEHSPLETLAYAVEKCRSEGVMPFNISLHGGEVTTLSKEDFRAVVSYIAAYYDTNGSYLSGAGFRLGTPHIKTNLFELDRHIETIRDYNVSISGSIDLPLSLHRAYRVTKDGRDTLDRILRNVSLLSELPNHKKVSATIFREHLDRMDELIEDIWFLHRNTCLDMTDFNFMIGFDSDTNELLHPLSDEEQLRFYRAIREAFTGTELEEALNTKWFAEFGPDYCTNCTNCGEKFFLLERNGDVYSCVRGQNHPEFYYGNIYESSMTEIMETAKRKIAEIHHGCGFSEDCAACGYLSVCKTGCPFVKRVNASPKSYTCGLQQALYPVWGVTPDPQNRAHVLDYVVEMHPERIGEYALPRIPNGIPALRHIIDGDPDLRAVYDDTAFILEIDGNRFPLAPQIIKQERPFTFMTPESRVILHVRHGVLSKCSSYPENNMLFIQLLTGDMIVYGDENREKQRHIATELIYKQVAEEHPSGIPGFDAVDLTHFFRRYGPSLSRTEANNVFFTTGALRDIHYTKQKNNAFYHIQAMDLPFPNLEFYYLNEEMLQQ
jgi:uncharacterized protein